MKNPENMTTDELIELADKIKRGMTTKFLNDLRISKKVSEKVNGMKNKSTITKKEAIMIADWVKSGISIEVLNDLRELKSARLKPLKVS